MERVNSNLTTGRTEEWFISDEEAEREVSGWTIRQTKLQPALVAREELWRLFEDRNTDWSSRALEMTGNALRATLSGPNLAHLFRIVTTEIASSSATESTSNKTTDMVAKVAVKTATQTLAKKAVSGSKDENGPELVGAYLEQAPEASQLRSKATSDAASKLTGSFITFILKIGTKGALGLATGGLGAAIAVAVAVVVYFRDVEQAKVVERRKTIVDDILTRYNTIRDKKQRQINQRDLIEKEALVKSNGLTDLQEDKQKKWLYKGISIEQSDIWTMRRIFRDSTSKMTPDDLNEFFLNFSNEFRFAGREGWGGYVFVKPKPGKSDDEIYDHSVSWVIFDRMCEYLKQLNSFSKSDIPEGYGDEGTNTSEVQQVKVSSFNNRK